MADTFNKEDKNLEILLRDIEYLRKQLREHYELWKSIPFELRRPVAWIVYNPLPESLKEAIFSEKTADINYNLAKKYNILEKASIFAELVGDVLLGILPLENFREKLGESLEIESEILEALFQDSQELIFSPLQKSLAQLYREK